MLLWTLQDELRYVAHETKYLTQLQKQVEESDMAVGVNKDFERECAEEKLEFEISYLESMRWISKSLLETDSRESKHISMQFDENRPRLKLVNDERASIIEKAEDTAELFDRIKKYVSSFRLFASTNRKIC